MRSSTVASWIAEVARKLGAYIWPNTKPKAIDAYLLSGVPKLSLCISTFNRAGWLTTNLRSWSRLYPEPVAGVEVLVCDNASTDRTADAVQAYLNRPDFRYKRNAENIGMLGNLRETVNMARGEYVWIIGDDDLIMPGSIERILNSLSLNPGVPLVYLNYAFTRLNDARKVRNFQRFFREATPIVAGEPDRVGRLRDICARNENFFTAIYTLVFRRDHGIRAYSQDTRGRAFSTMLSCIPTTYYVLNHLMDEVCVWIGEPQIVVNLNVSWMSYASLWILERIPEVYDEAQKRGVPKDAMDRWRLHTLPAFVHYFEEIYRDDPLGNAEFFSPKRALSRYASLPEFAPCRQKLREIYAAAQRAGHPAAQMPVDSVFPS